MPERLLAVLEGGSGFAGRARRALRGWPGRGWPVRWLCRLRVTSAVLPLLEVNARKPFEDGEVRYSCQATEMLRAAPVCLPLRDIGQYLEDVTSGNASAPAVTRVLLWSASSTATRTSADGSCPAPALPRRPPLALPARAGVTSGRTPTEHLDLQPGELVRIKTREEILATLDANLLNRGMGFDAEMSRFCGRTARVKARVDRCVDEQTGRMLTMKNPCIILEDIVCEGAFSANCPREFVCWWREIWLERVPERLSDHGVEPSLPPQEAPDAALQDAARDRAEHDRPQGRTRPALGALRHTWSSRSARSWSAWSWSDCSIPTTSASTPSRWRRTPSSSTSTTWA